MLQEFPSPIGHGLSLARLIQNMILCIRVEVAELLEEEITFKPKQKRAQTINSNKIIIKQEKAATTKSKKRDSSKRRIKIDDFDFDNYIKDLPSIEQLMHDIYNNEPLKPTEEHSEQPSKQSNS